ncbi:MAG: PQQ-binding-like beta-propeller repeat protein [Planctomycetaceae bacterium]
MSRSPVISIVGHVGVWLLLVASPRWDAAWAQDWPQFRGPNGQGVIPAVEIPEEFGEETNLRFKIEIPGKGWSSPVVSQGICWLTTAVPIEADPARLAEIRAELLKKNPMAAQLEVLAAVSLRVVAVDLAQQKIIHDIELFEVEEPEPIHSLNSYASPTPVIAGGRLLCHFGNLGTAAVDLATGKVLWKTRLPLEHSVGPGSTPVVVDDRLIIPCDGVDRQFVAALDVATGRELWRVPRPRMSGDNGDFHKAFSTPLVIGEGTRRQVIIPGAQWVVSYDPATGKTLWQVRHGDGFSNSPRPVFAHGLVFVCTGYMNHELVAIRVDGEGDVTETHIAWRMNKQVPPMSSPVVVGDFLYMVSDQGVVSCLKARTGEVRYRERLAGNYSASPLAVGDRILFLSRSGDASWVGAKPEWNLRRTNHLEGQLMASPAVALGTLLVRSDSHLYGFPANGR